MLDLADINFDPISLSSSRNGGAVVKPDNPRKVRKFKDLTDISSELNTLLEAKVSCSV